MYLNSPGSQQCIVTISCDSGWTGIPDVRYDEAGTSGEGGGGGDDDEDDISFLRLFSVSYIACRYNKLTSKANDNNHSLKKSAQHQLDSGFVPFFRNKFPGLFQDLDGLDLDRAQRFSQPLQFQDLNVNSAYCLLYTSYFLVEFNRFSELSGSSGLFPGLSSPGKCHNKIPGLSRFSRTRMNPVDFM